MPLPLPHRLMAAGLGTALFAGLAVATPAMADEPLPRDSAKGLLVFATEQPGNNQQYTSVDGARGEFSGKLHEDLLDAVEQARELDLSRFESDGRIELPGDGAGICLGVARAPGAQTQRALPQPCVEDDPNQEWRVRTGTENRLQNVGTGLWPSNMRSVGAWTMTGSPSSSPYKLLTRFLDGRPEALPRFTRTYDQATDTIVLHGRNGSPLVPVEVSDGVGPVQQIATSSAEGTFSATVPADLSNRATIEVRFGDDEWSATSIRAVPVANLRIARDADGDVVLHGIAAGYATVNVGTGPLAADVVQSRTASASGGVTVPLPGAEPGDTFFVYQREDGVRSRVTIPNRSDGIIATTAPETELERGESTPVPVQVVARTDLTRLTPEFRMTAPEGTVFTPGQQFIDGQLKPAGGDWQAVDVRLRAGAVTISADGRTLTASGSITTMTFREGDEICWLPTLDVVDPAVAPAAV